jgi:hypothetical protein
MSVMNQDEIRCVLDTRTLHGAMRACMDRVAGFDRWPQQVHAGVQTMEREAREYAADVTNTVSSTCIGAG